MAMKRKALMYLGGYRQLKDFIWYYLYKGTDFEWDLICQPMFDEMPLREICERTGIFHDIFMPKPYITQRKSKLLLFSVRMGLYWLLGNPKRFAQKEIAKICDLNKYDLICISTTRGVTPGLIACAAEGMELDLLEDGIGDNTDANIRFELKRIMELRYIASYLFAKMGYFNIGCTFPLKSTKKFARYSNKPEELSECLYKCIHQMNDMSSIDRVEYSAIIDRTFEKVNDISDADALLFTASLKDFDSKRFINCNKAVVRFLCEKGYRKIIFKRHPRDYTPYEFDDLTMVEEIEPYITAEDIISLVDKQDVYFMFPSSAVLGMKDVSNNSYILKFNELSDIKLYIHGYKDGSDFIRKAGIDFAEITL
ncbi:MAG: hypothetical protein HFH11_02875 [Dorea sp.]|nr:hypothetical protein [Dorea sp.]